MTGLEIHLDRGAIDRLEAHLADLSVHAAAARTQNRVKENITSAGRVATGNLRDSVVIRRESQARYTVRSDKSYAIFQEEGIGAVYPVKAKVLRFKPRGSSVFIFRPRTKGFPGAHFFRDALRSLSLRDFQP